ncbi:hypothetical protein VMCG_03256 [Cytospora schulzeri]|uniref:FAD-binding PCMH-type domain-containing protein n=1 Tax=Cytospora schulzeri TaxID=448051 RepID=A0A423WYF8_9PEZI|nr:hypothetical protein VMCG_03256 [Valsa malicola]
MYPRIISLPLALQLAGLVRPIAGAYSDIASVAEFIERLDLSPAASSYVTSALNGSDVDSISSLNEQEKASYACLVTGAALGADVVNQSASNYVDMIQVNWCDSCWYEPRCIAQPKSAIEVSKALLVATFLGTKFAVRSGGHNPNPGFAGIDSQGVLIDMSHMNETSLSTDGTVASLGPGNRFSDVYETLNSMGKTIMGGRLNSVGLGGYFLGGGLTYFSSKYGLAADNIVNYEIVLANSSIISANATSHPDLWWALKGSGTNFGIVTRYDVKAQDNDSVWFEGLNYAPSQNEKLLDAIIQYASVAENDSNAAITFSLTPDSGFVEFIYGKPVERPAAYSMFYNISSSGTAINSTIGNMVALNNAISNITPIPKMRRMIASTGHKFDPPTLKGAYNMFLDFASDVEKYNATVGFVVQPFTSAAVLHATKTGGNPTGFNKTLQNLLSLSIEWKDSVHDNEVLTAFRNYTDRVEDLAKTNDVFLEAKAMNDAGYMQNVLASYGPKNLAQLRSIATQYDPLKVFQDLQNNGFLLAKA